MRRLALALLLVVSISGPALAGDAAVQTTLYFGLGLKGANMERMAYMENALAYQTSLSFLNGRFRALRVAIQGQ